MNVKNMKSYKDMKTTLAINRKEWLEKHQAVDITVGLKQTDGETKPELCYKFWVMKKVGVSALTKKVRVKELLEGSLTDVRQEEIIPMLYDEPTDKEIDPMYTDDGTKRIRPVKLGYSTGNATGPTGTPGFLYKKSNQYFMLNNAHVGAESPFLFISQQEARNVQQGVAHGGSLPDDFLANMRYMILLNDHANKENVVNMQHIDMYAQAGDGTIVPHATSPNSADACLIGPLELGSDIVNEFLDNLKGPQISSYKCKPGDNGTGTSWRMNGIVKGLVTDTGKTSLVQHSDGKIAKMVDCIVTERMGAPGTSGSGFMIILEDGRHASAGLNFAGNDSLNLICPIQHIDVAFSGEVVTIQDNVPPEPQPNINDEEIQLIPLNNGKWKIIRRVTDLNTKNPIQNAIVSLGKEIGGLYEYIGHTNGSGYIEFSDIDEGQYVLIIQAGGYKDYTSEVILGDNNARITKSKFKFW